jgi:hypothetical protein
MSKPQNWSQTLYDTQIDPCDYEYSIKLPDSTKLLNWSLYLTTYYQLRPYITHWVDYWYWLETLNCSHLKVSSSILPYANFGGLVHTKLCSDSEFKWGPASGRWDWTPRTSWSLDLIPSFHNKNKIYDVPIF